MPATAKKQKQRLAILRQVYTRGPISRVDIAHITGITPAITGSIVSELIQEGILAEVGFTGPTRPGSGRKRVLLALVGGRTYYIGSELSEGAFTFSLVDNVGHAVKQQVIHIAPADVHKVINAHNYLKYLQSFIAQCQKFKPAAIGIALPGHFNGENQRISSSNPLWQQFAITSVVSSISLPTFLENNVHCMAIAAHLISVPHPGDNFTYFHLGRGIFSSYVHNGQVHGHNNFLIGEVGHTIVNPSGPICECGRRGCLQTYASEGSIIKHVHALFQSGNKTYLHQLTNKATDITFDNVLQAYNMGDDGVAAILDDAMNYIAQTINNLSIMLDSRQIILHGRIFQPVSLAKLLKSDIQQNQFLINGTTLQPVNIQKYSVSDGADAAATMAASQLLLHTNQ